MPHTPYAQGTAAPEYIHNEFAYLFAAQAVGLFLAKPRLKITLVGQFCPQRLGIYVTNASNSEPTPICITAESNSMRSEIWAVWTSAEIYMSTAVFADGARYCIFASPCHHHV